MTVQVAAIGAKLPVPGDAFVRSLYAMNAGSLAFGFGWSKGGLRWICIGLLLVRNGWWFDKSLFPTQGGNLVCLDDKCVVNRAWELVLAGTQPVWYPGGQPTVVAV